MAEVDQMLNNENKYQSQKSQVSSKKIKIKVSDEQRKKLKSAKSNASQNKQPGGEGPSLSID